MATTNTTKQFSDEKILVDPAEDINDGTAEKEAIVPKSTDDKMLAPLTEKMTLDESNFDKEAPPSYQSGSSPSQPAEEKPTLAANEEEAVAEEKVAVAASTSRSLTTPSSSRISPSASYQEHSFCHVNALRINHNILLDPNRQATYFIEVSGFVKGRDDVVIRQLSQDLAGKGNTLTADEGKTGSVVAFAQFPRGRDNFTQLALGDHENLSTVQWLGLSRTSENEDWRLLLPGKPGHTFQLAMNLDSSAPTNSSAQTSPLDNKSSTGSFKVVEIESGAVVAAYTELKTMSSWKKRGKLRLYDGALRGVEGIDSDDLQLLIILCCAVMNEKRRRKTVRKWAGIGIL